MKIITIPWKDDLMHLVANAQKSIKISSPFVKKNISDEILNCKKKSTHFELITSFRLMNLYNGSLDLDGLENIINSKGVVKNYPKLHAKIYLFDDEQVIITSANLTNGGLLNNFEFGLLTDNKDVVSESVNMFNQISKSDITGKIEPSHIKTVREILSKIPKKQNHDFVFPNYEIESPEDNYNTIPVPKNVIDTSLSGWRLEVFKLLVQIESQVFTLKEVTKYESNLIKIYPNNRNIPAKIRQQLQFLRDLGLIEFLGNGKYKKLWL